MSDDKGAQRPKKRKRADIPLAERIKCDLPKMMYGFGDVPEPAAETVDALYELVETFVDAATSIGLNAARAEKSGGSRNASVLKHLPLVWAIRRDRRLHERIIELLVANNAIKKSRRLEELNMEPEKK